MKKLKKSKKSKKPLIIESGKVTIGQHRSSFMKVLQLTGKEGKTKTCSTAILIPKKDKKTVKLIKETIRWVAREKFGSKADPFKAGSKHGHNLQDGDMLCDDDESKVGDEGKGHYLLSTKAYSLPKVVDRDVQRIIDSDELHECCSSGNWFNFVLEFKPYDFKLDEGGRARGIRCELKHVQYCKEGDRLDGSTNPEDEFESLDDDDDDDDDD